MADGHEGSPWAGLDAWQRRDVEHSLLRITPEALSIITTEQWHAIEQLLARGNDIRVGVPNGTDTQGALVYHNGDATEYGVIHADGRITHP